MRVFIRLFSLLFVLIFGIMLCAAENGNPQNILIQRDDVKLHGKMYRAENLGLHPTVLLLNGFPGNETDVLGLGNQLSHAGYNVLTFNYSGTYQSEGQWSFENSQSDIQAAFDYLMAPENIQKYQIDTTHIALGGWSFGGGMALTYAIEHPEVKSVFSIAGTDHGKFMREYFYDQEFASIIDEIFNELKAPSGPVRFASGTMPREASSEKVMEILNSALYLKMNASKLHGRNILLIGGFDDLNNPIEDHMLPLYRELQRIKATNVKMVAFQDAHPFRNTREPLADSIISWMKDISAQKAQSLSRH